MIPINNKSTPISSSSNLDQLISIGRSNEPNDNQIKKIEFLTSSIFKDQKMLKESFGVYQVYNGIDSRTWYSTIKAYCKLHYQNPNEVLEYFHIFLHKDLKTWFLKLDDSKKRSLDDFESVFLDEVFKRENE